MKHIVTVLYAIMMCKMNFHVAGNIYVNVLDVLYIQVTKSIKGRVCFCLCWSWIHAEAKNYMCMSYANIALHDGCC